MTNREINNDCLAKALHALDIHFVGVAGTIDGPTVLSPVALIGGLAQSCEARLRLALIPLFLQRGDFAEFVPRALAILDDPAQVTLKCYYTAALLLQQKYKSQFASGKPLPDLFSWELALPQQEEPTLALKALGRYQAGSTGDAINWAGTYEYAAQRLLKMEKSKQFA